MSQIKTVWISRSGISCSRTRGFRICTLISLKWSFPSHRCILYLMPLSMTLFGLETAMWLIAPFQSYWSTNPGSLRSGTKDFGPWDSHHSTRILLSSAIYGGFKLKLTSSYLYIKFKQHTLCTHCVANKWHNSASVGFRRGPWLLLRWTTSCTPRPSTHPPPPPHMRKKRQRRIGAQKRVCGTERGRKTIVNSRKKYLVH